MRLRDYQNLLEINIKRLKSVTLSVAGTSRGLIHDYKMSGLFEFNKVVDEYQNVGLFNDVIKNYKNFDFLKRMKDEIILDENEYKQLKSIVDNLKIQSNNLKIVIDSILKNEDKNTINLKIPSSISNISEFRNFIDNLDLMFHVYRELSCDINFNGVDSGSSWIVVAFAAGSIVKKCIEFILEIAEKSLELRKLKLDGDRKKLELEELKHKISIKEYNNIIRAREEENDKNYSNLRETIAIQLLYNLKLEEKEIKNRNELIEKTKIALDKMGELLDLGMEIKPALNASEEIKQISDNFNKALDEHKKFLIGLSQQKLIEQKNDLEDKKSENDKNEEDNIDEKE